jgi:sec-independent protein translocase protein TatC
MSKKKKKFHQEIEQPLLAHLIELRQRLMRSLLAVLIIFLCLLPFANPIFNALAVPLLDYYLSAGSSIIATEVASTFLIPFKTVLVFSFFLAIPVIL